MKEASQALGGSGRRTLDHELELVRGAIALVASGSVRRVECSGLQFGAQLLGPARAFGHDTGVRVTPIWGLDEDGVALAIERATDA
jgi:hypothetical protein